MIAAIEKRTEKYNATTKANNIEIPTFLDLDRFWEESYRVVKPDGCIALFAQTPFDKVLGCSNLKDLRYEWIWEKSQVTGHLNSKRMPMKAHENILIFYRKLPTYNPQMTHNHDRKVSSADSKRNCTNSCKSHLP